MNAGNPLFLTSYTEVTSGELGNGLVNGIVHNNNQTVNLLTYQYELREVKEPHDFIQYLPSDENLEMYITVFGKPIETDVKDNNTNKSESIKIYPNPASDEITVSFKNKSLNSSNIKIYSTLGELVHDETFLPRNSNIYSNKIDISELNPGVYIVLIRIGNQVLNEKFVVAE